MVDADGSNRSSIPLAPAPASPQFGREFVRDTPSLAPDGRHFAYVRAYGLQSRLPEICVASVDGTEDRRLRAGTSPRWSPDGRQIAFVAPPKNFYTPSQGEGPTWVMSAQTGRLVRRLSRRSLSGMDWSPDGRRLVASVGQHLFIFRTHGAPARPRPVTTPARRRSADLDAAWAPDGRRIAFVRHVDVRPFPNAEFDDQWEIWTISPRGTAARRIWQRYDHYDSDRGGPDGLSWQALPR